MSKFKKYEYEIHELKTWPEYFKAVKNGTKTFELRKDDRDYKIGDILKLREYDPITESYTNQVCMRVITYILKGGVFGLQEGFVILGLGSHFVLSEEEADLIIKASNNQI
jgi:ribosomal protein S17